MSLFEIDDPNAALGYRNFRAATDESVAGQIRLALERLWTQYEPYADSDFKGEFSRQPDPRFWEMYLAVQLLRLRRKLGPRAEIEPAARDAGPDISIRKGRRTIWIEAIAPSAGEAPGDRVPDLFPQDEFVFGPNLSRRQIELRITSALLTKARKFQTYREQGLVGENDSCVVAVSAGQFSLQAVETGLPYAVTAVYRFGEEHFLLNRRGAPKLSGPYFDVSVEIERANGAPIPRTAFQHPLFSHISGLLWSRLSIGNFLGQPHDFIYVHNATAEKPIPRRWARWSTEFFPINGGNTLQRHPRRRRKNVWSKRPA